MQLTSSAFASGQEMPQKYGKKVKNISLPLTWSGAPAGTKSFAFSIVDKAPIARNYVHWMVADIPGNVMSIKEDAAGKAMPAGAKELKPYAGPFPPSGTHDYEITLYALKTDKLDVPSKVNLDVFTAVVKKDALATAVLKGTFTKIKTS